MWVAEFKVWHKGSGVLEITKLLNCECTAIYLNSIERNNQLYTSKVIVVKGEASKELVEGINSDERVSITHVEGNQIFYEIEGGSSFHTVVFNRNVFFVKPFVIRNGFEYWTVASWDKKELYDLKKKIDKLKGLATIELLGIKESNINLFLPSLFQNLTDKQLTAFLHAVNYGYYSLPRKKSLKQIAKDLGVPMTSLRDHLRKAESKILPSIAQNINLSK